MTDQPQQPNDQPDQRPDAAFSDFGAGHPEERMSRLAPLALGAALMAGGTGIFAIASKTLFPALITPVISLLGIFIASIALITITRSRGRIAGAGIALAGMGLCVVVSVLSMGLLLGAMSGAGRIGAAVNEAMAAAMDRNADELRYAMHHEARERFDQQMLDDFARLVEGQVGGFVGSPDQVLRARSLWNRVLPAMERITDSGLDQRVIPWPAEFENDAAVVLLILRSRAAMAAPYGQIVDIAVLTNEGFEVRLIGDREPEAPEAPEAEPEAETGPPPRPPLHTGG
ncbi:MAG: hypothetical protein EA423_00740 [Phycisphaerales bacterium]|nr:MAG: hypothetical protein EA423_00740 [Phycisphaerales bacterium]